MLPVLARIMFQQGEGGDFSSMDAQSTQGSGAAPPAGQFSVCDHIAKENLCDIANSDSYSFGLVNLVSVMMP